MSGPSALYKDDEVGAIVFDVGQSSLRVGYAREMSPLADIPAVVGVSEDGTSTAMLTETMDVDQQMDSNITSKKRYYIDSTALNVPTEGMEVVSYMKDGVIDDWDLFEKMLDYTYAKFFKSSFHPVLMTESPLNPSNKRQKLTEIMFEKYNVPGFFLAKNAVMAAFAVKQTTGLVVDSGATHTTAVPVQDGSVITQGIVKSPLGGDYITMQCKQYLQECNIDVVPTYIIAGKKVVKEKGKANWVKKRNIPEVTTSWHNYMVKKVIQDFQNCVLKVSHTPFNENNISSMPAIHYEFPHGYHQKFGVERFRIPESMFGPCVPPVHGGVAGDSMLGIGHIVTTSIGKCDPDVQSALHQNIVLTGGNSFMPGFTERFKRDLSMLFPSRRNVKLRPVAASRLAERRFGSWIGGSIMASCGGFQQLWISSVEYEEGGKSEVDRKCP